MTEFVSDIKTIPHRNSIIYETLADLNNLKYFKDRIPPDKISDFTFDSDSCTFSVQPVGSIRFYVVDREPIKTIKLTATQSSMEAFMWIQLKETGEQETKIKLTIKADLNPIVKMMISQPLKEGINKIAEMLASINYETLG